MNSRNSWQQQETTNILKCQQEKLKAPFIEEMIYRGLFCSFINKNFDNNLVYVIFSSLLFSFCNNNKRKYKIANLITINFSPCSQLLSIQKKRDTKTFQSNSQFLLIFQSNKTLISVVQMTFTFFFGLYSAFIFIQAKAVISCIVLHGFCNFMGLPNFGDLFIKDKYQDQRIQKSQYLKIFQENYLNQYFRNLDVLYWRFARFYCGMLASYMIYQDLLKFLYFHQIQQFNLNKFMGNQCGCEEQSEQQGSQLLKQSKHENQHEHQVSKNQPMQILVDRESLDKFSQSNNQPAQKHRGRESEQIGHQDFVILNELGHGGFGRVYQAQLQNPYKLEYIREKSREENMQASKDEIHQIDGQIWVCAIKKISQECLKKGSRMKDRIMLQRDVMFQNQQHPFIVKLFCSFQTKSSIFLAMEYCEGGNLMSYIDMSRGRGMGVSVSKFILSEIVTAIQYLHEKMLIMYRDVKPENVLITKRGHAKIADFGLSFKMQTITDRTKTRVGTPQYMAPEIIMGRDYDRSVDLWAIGILLYQMMCTKTPFHDQRPFEIEKKIIENKIIFPIYFPERPKNLIQKLLMTNPEYRLGMNSFDDIQQDIFFTGVNWQKIIEKSVKSPIQEIIQLKANKKTEVIALADLESSNSYTDNQNENNIDFFTLKVSWDHDFEETGNTYGINSELKK